MAKTRLTKVMKEGIVQGVLQGIPKVDYKSIIQDYFNKRAYDELPEALKADEFREYIAESYVGCFHLYVRNAKFEPTREDRAYVDQQTMLGREQYDNLRAIKCNLMAALERCRYVEVFAEQFPEFVKYLPKEEAPVVNLPSIQLKETLASMGWPRSNEGE